MPKPLINQPDSISPDTLDHAREFVGIVIERAPAVYRDLLAAPEVRQRLSGAVSFNHGKVLAWAQFLVFRQEFIKRFPEASRSACINAFCGLFLKNDISMTNLADVMEVETEDGLQHLTSRQVD